MQYLRDMRFEQARRNLLMGASGDCVSRIALDAGFLHLGRFAIEYRRRYGESPSQTLSRVADADPIDRRASTARQFAQTRAYSNAISAQGTGR